MAPVHNFADDNTLPPFVETVSKLINILKIESELINEWFKKNDSKPRQVSSNNNR